MPQSTFEYLQGLLTLIRDTLSQRMVNRSPPENHTLFSSSTYLEGQMAIVTGANTGIGLETTQQLVAAGAKVIMACRNTTKAEEAVKTIRSGYPKAELEIAQLDLLSPDSVRAFASWFGDTRPLHMLVLNGGVMGVGKAAPETHFTVNHVGHALLTLLLLPRIAAVRGRVVFVSSLTFAISDLRLDDIDFRKRRYNWMTAYANSKLAMVMFMHALAGRVRDAVDVNAVHPGEATSDVARNLGWIWMTLHQRVGSLFLLSTEEAARTSTYVAGAEEVRGITKTMFHRVWHTLSVPTRLLQPGDVEKLWDVTLERAGITDADLIGLRKVMPEVVRL